MGVMGMIFLCHTCAYWLMVPLGILGTKGIPEYLYPDVMYIITPAELYTQTHLISHRGSYPYVSRF